VQTQARSVISVAGFEQGVADILQDQEDKYSVIVHDFSSNYTYRHNPDYSLLPVSTSKISVVIMVLRDIQAGKIKFDIQFPTKEKNKPYSSDALYSREPGTLLTVEEYLYFLFYASDNTAMLSLEDMLGGWQVLNK